MSPRRPTPPTSTVIVCAYTEDRWDDLVDAVRSSISSGHRPDQVVVVIDHNEALLARSRQTFITAALGVPVIVAPNAGRKGLSGARNTGVELSTGAVVVFLDDDARARPGWLAALLHGYGDPVVIGVGGVARPAFPGDRPSSLPAGAGDRPGELDWVVGCTYAGQPTHLEPVRNLMGCNMSLRRDVFERAGGFSDGLGRVGRTPLGCEETELCIRAARVMPEGRILFQPSAVVDHRVSVDRVRWNYLLRRSWAEGLSKAVVSRMEGRDQGLSTERAYTTRILPVALLRELGRGMRGRGFGGAVAIPAALLVTAAGYLRGGLSRRTLPPAPAAIGRRAVGVAPQEAVA